MNAGRSTRGLALALAIGATLAFQNPPSVRRAETPQDRAEELRRRAIQAEADEAMLAKAFRDCDANGNGWISFKEAEAAMSLDRDGFAIFDKDRDGRVDPAEFKERHDTIVKFGGAFPMPLSTAAARRATNRSAEELFRVYDHNSDDALDLLELKEALDAHKIASLPADVALKTLDQDASGKLEATELERLIEIIRPSGASDGLPAPRSIAELFGKALERASQGDVAIPEPPLIPGPVTAFRRLDLDEDGRIDAQDLLELARPIQVRVRVHALLATLDVDGDGGLSETEFWTSMGVVR